MFAPMISENLAIALSVDASSPPMTRILLPYGPTYQSFVVSSASLATLSLRLVEPTRISKSSLSVLSFEIRSSVYSGLIPVVSLIFLNTSVVADATASEQYELLMIEKRASPSFIRYLTSAGASVSVSVSFPPPKSAQDAMSGRTSRSAISVEASLRIIFLRIIFKFPFLLSNSVSPRRGLIPARRLRCRACNRLHVRRSAFRGFRARLSFRDRAP